MDPNLAWVRRLWDMWNVRLLVLLSFLLQIILSLFGNRRKYISSMWISIPIWLAYLMANWVATVALGNLSNTQVDALLAIWAPLLLLHLGGPDTITAYAPEDNQLWMRYLLGLLVQFSIAIYVILKSWQHSWFSVMSIPALLAGLIKFGERVWVLMSVNNDKSGDILPVNDLGEQSNRGNNNTLEDEKWIHVLCIAQRFLKEFKSYMEYYELRDQKFPMDNLPEVNDIKLFWNVIEVEMGLMFDLLYTKAAINFRKGGWILRCITFACTMTVLTGLIFRRISTVEDQEKWHKVDIAITELLVVGTLALEIYAIIALYLFSDWAMLWLIKHDRSKQVIQLRKKISWPLFLPKQYRCNMVAQFNVVKYCLEDVKPDQKVGKRILRSLLRIPQFRDMKYSNETADIVPPLLFGPILFCRNYLLNPHLHDGKFVELKNSIWEDFFEKALYSQIFCLHLATEVCYNLEMDWDITDHDASSGSSSSREDNRTLCRTLSNYMMYLLVMRSSLLPINASTDVALNTIHTFKQLIEGEQGVKVACERLLAQDDSSEFPIREIVTHVRDQPKDERWKILKLKWVRMLCYVASKGHKNEHLRQLSQGGEFLTFLWFFLPQSGMLSDPAFNHDYQCHAR